MQCFEDLSFVEFGKSLIRDVEGVLQVKYIVLIGWPYIEDGLVRVVVDVILPGGLADLR